MARKTYSYYITFTIGVFLIVAGLFFFLYSFVVVKSYGDLSTIELLRGLFWEILLMPVIGLLIIFRNKS